MRQRNGKLKGLCLTLLTGLSKRGKVLFGPLVLGERMDSESHLSQMGKGGSLR